MKGSQPVPRLPDAQWLASTRPDLHKDRRREDSAHPGGLRRPGHPQSVPAHSLRIPEPGPPPLRNAPLRGFRRVAGSGKPFPDLTRDPGKQGNVPCQQHDTRCNEKEALQDRQDETRHPQQQQHASQRDSQVTLHGRTFPVADVFRLSRGRPDRRPPEDQTDATCCASGNPSYYFDCPSRKP